MLCRIIGKEAWRFQFLMQSDNLTEIDRRQYRALGYLLSMGCDKLLRCLVRREYYEATELLGEYEQQ